MPPASSFPTWLSIVRMSYAAFHLIFLVPAIILLWATLPQSLSSLGGWRAQWAIPLVAAIAFTYTTPWDNYLVAREVWWYGPDRVLATIGYVPVEEYLFFLLQPILTGLFTFQYLARAGGNPTTRSSRGMWAGVVLFGGLSLLGVGLLISGAARGLYLGLILAWACPLLTGMWLYDGETLWAHRRVLLYAIGGPTLYLWIADATAIASGIWTIADAFTLGIAPGGLPLEEATFFLVTNCLVVKGILLLLFGEHDSLHRLQKIESAAPLDE